MFNFQPFYFQENFGSLIETILGVIFPLFVLTFSQNFPLRTQAQKQS